MSKLIYIFFLIKVSFFQMIYCLGKDYNIDNKYNEKRKLEEFRNISIYIDTFYLESISKPPDSKKSLQIYKDALDKAKNALQKLIKVENKASGINVENYLNIIKEKFYIDDSQYRENLQTNFNSNYDLIVFVTKKSSMNDNTEVINHFKYCNEFPQIHSYNEYNRPIIGSFIINDDYYSQISNDTYKTEFFSYHCLHQLTHILGFNKDTLQKFSNKIEFEPKESTRINNTNNLPVRREIIKCNNQECKLIEFAKKYFNCSDLTSLELEEKLINNDDCKNYTHWETRIFSGEYMTPNIYFQDQVISEFTLYLLEETGLYKVNNFTGGLMRFGKNAKCEFFKNDCNEEKPENEILHENQTTVRNSLFKNEFCSGNTKTTCSPGRQSRGLCDNHFSGGKFSVEEKQIYSRENEDIWKLYGNEYAEYCPISISEIEVSQTNEFSYIGNCNIGQKDNFGSKAFSYWNNALANYSIFSNNYGEKFSSTSFCAFSSVIHLDDDKKFYKGFIRPTCYEMHCSKRSLTIIINEQYIVCPRSGGYIRIGGNYEGHILCPDYNLICSQTVPCNNMFDCVEKESRMKDFNEYGYDYTPYNVSIQIIEIPEDSNFKPAYEESDDGKCPINCSQCYENRKCFKCRDDIYIGDAENDKNPINCSYEAPITYFYKHNETHFFRCIDNCKYCTSPNKCYQCEPEFILDSNNHCVPRIEGCLRYNKSTNFSDTEYNNGGMGYKECEECDNSNNYYCVKKNKEDCKKISDIDTYFLNEVKCRTKCEEKYDNCIKCDINHCEKCEGTHYLNDEFKCLLGIEHCEELNLESPSPECIKCKGNYRCLNKDQTKCAPVDNLDSYYYVDDNRNTNDCMEKCSKTYSEKCNKCTKDECLNCEDNYFLYEKKDCFEKLEHCINHSLKGIQILCLECEQDFHCINNNKSLCSYISNDELHTIYYKADNEPNPCYEKCSEAIPYCIECDNKDICRRCQPNINLTDEGKCVPIVPPPGQCLVKTYELNDSISDVNLKTYPTVFFNNYPNFHAIDHYVNNNFTITVFIHSECTEELLSKGYFKINSTELQYSFAEEFGSNINLTYIVFVTHNYKSHLRFYSDYLKYLNSDEKINSIKNKEYIITNNYTSSIQKEFGSLVANLVKAEKFNIFDKDSDIFNDYCRNVTFFSIDMPLKQRAILYTHIYSERMACLGEDCELTEINCDDTLSTCRCKIGNKFEDILEEDQFEPYSGIIKEQNNFMDSIGIIKCTKSGFKNLKANVGFYLVVAGIVAQIALYIIYSLCSKPVVKLPKSVSNPPKKALMILSDWDKIKKSTNQSENEVFIQPRDDDDDQLMEEERSYINDVNFSDVSIDTNVGGMNLRSEKNYNEKPNKKILILLNNKGGKKSKSQKEYEEIQSESELSLNNKEEDLSKKSFCRIYLIIVTLKQHIINFFSVVYCLKITKSHIPLTMQIIRSLFIFFLSFVLNILFLNQDYYIKKFNHFNEKYVFFSDENLDITIPTGEKISYAIGHTFGFAMVVFIILIIVNFLIGIIFFYLRNKIKEIKNKSDIQKEIKDLVKRQKQLNLIFFIINIVLMLIFLLTITAFVGAYGGGFVDYFTAGLISLIFLELFPFLWSLVIALFTYFGYKKNNKFLIKLGDFFMF